MKIDLKREWCKGCGVCIEICPKDVFDRESKISSRGFREIVIRQPEKCTGCMLCEMLCPDLVITIETEKDTANKNE
jgi:2-oxoglutarate ferredoxin oxidoreductase subunit delta